MFVYSSLRFLLLGPSSAWCRSLFLAPRKISVEAKATLKYELTDNVSKLELFRERSWSDSDGLLPSRTSPWPWMTWAPQEEDHEFSEDPTAGCSLHFNVRSKKSMWDVEGFFCGSLQLLGSLWSYTCLRPTNQEIGCLLFGQWPADATSAHQSSKAGYTYSSMTLDQLRMIVVTSFPDQLSKDLLEDLKHLVKTGSTS